MVALLRAERNMPQAVLAQRALVHRSTILRLERGQIRPRPSLLGWVAYGLDPDHSRAIREVLVDMAGGCGALADDGGWGGLRARKANRLMASGRIQLPSDLEDRIRMHQRAAAARHRADVILSRPGALDNARLLDLAHAYMAEAQFASTHAGGLIGLGSGKYRVTIGLP